MTVTAPAHTALTASTESSDLNINLARTAQFATGALTTQRAVRIQAPTYGFVGASTLTTASTVQIDSAPVAGTNATITNAYALRVLTGTAAGVGIVIQGATSQTGDLFEVKNTSGTDLFSLNNNGTLLLNPYGTSTGQTNEIRFLELAANGTNYVGFKAGNSIASNVIWTLPTADGTNGQVLSTNASGVLSWSSAGSGTVTSIATTSPITGGTITGTGTIGINASSANTASYVVQRDASGDFSAGKITLGGSGSSTSAQLTFSGSTNNWIDFGTNGYAPPTFTTRGVGTKVVFYKDLGASSTDYAAGVQINALWFSIPAATSDRAFRFYGGITNIASLTGDGSFSANKTITGETLSSTVAIGTAPITVTSTTQVTNLNASLLEGYSTATANTVSTIVRRDASGNFSAGTITAALTGNASTATSLAGGGAGQVPYNTASGATSFLAAGTAGQVLQSNATSAPSWSSRVNYTAGTSAPVSPLAGDQWYDTNTGALLVYVNDGNTSQWVEASNPSVGSASIESNGRLTLASGVPVSTTDQTAKTTIYYTPYDGNFLSIYNGTSWNAYSFAELSLALGTLTSGKNYDVFAYISGSTVTLELSTAWTSDTARADAISLLNGVYIKTSNNTRRYLGTFRTTATTTTEDSLTKRFVWNINNQQERPVQKFEATASWTYQATAWRYVNNSSTNRVECVFGLSSAINLVASGFYNAGATMQGSRISIGEDSSTAYAANCNSQGGATIPNGYAGSIATLTFYPALGYHFYSWIESSFSGAATTFYGEDVGYRRTGISGYVVN